MERVSKNCLDTNPSVDQNWPVYLVAAAYHRTSNPDNLMGTTSNSIGR